jgi:hypothetical protein
VYTVVRQHNHGVITEGAFEMAMATSAARMSVEKDTATEVKDILEQALQKTG